VPIGSSRRHVQAHEIVVLMTSAAAHFVNAVPVGSPADLHGVSMTVVSLSREISPGVAIHTARMAEHGHNCFESSGRASIIARDCFMNELCSGMFHSWRRDPWD
jgi:hypothetical protein